MPPQQRLEALWDAVLLCARCKAPDPIVAWQEYIRFTAKRKQILDSKGYTAFHFHGGGKVDVRAARSIGVAVGHARFGAAGNGVIKRLFKGCALGDIEGDDFLVVEQFGEARAVLDGFRHGLEGFVADGVTVVVVDPLEVVDIDHQAGKWCL